MHLLLMALVVCGLTLNETTILDTTEGEWVAPGYVAIEEATIDPLDYDAELMGTDPNKNGAIRLASLGFFVETEDGEKWRIVMVFKDKIIIEQEDAEIREIPLNISGQGAFFSKGGKYVLVHGGIYDSISSELINLDDGTSEPFDSGLDDGVTFTWIGDNGTVVTFLTCTRRSGDNSLLSFFDHTELIRSVERDFDSGRGMSQDGDLFVSGVGSVETPALAAYDGEGNLIWEVEIPSNRRFNDLGISITRDASHIIIPGRGGVSCYSGDSGELVWNYVDSPRTTVSPSGEILFIPMQTSNSGRTLLYRTGDNEAISRALMRYFVINSDNSLLWISPWFNNNTGSFSCGAQNNNSEQYMGDGPLAINATGNRVLYDDGYSIHIIRIEREVSE